jgi:hypothetical protein
MSYAANMEDFSTQRLALFAHQELRYVTDITRSKLSLYYLILNYVFYLNVTYPF